MRPVVSLAMEIALDGYAGYAGGLGVLEADKFYAAGRLGIPYISIVPFYPRGYVDYNSADGSKLVEVRHRHSPDFLARLRHIGSVSARGREGKIVAEAEVLEYSYGSARALLYRITRPAHAASLFKYLYRHQDSECEYYAIASAISAEIVRKLGEPYVVDVQESHLAPAMPLLRARKRLITHTPGPWGHPRLCGEMAELLDISLPAVSNMTELGMEEAESVIAVSRKHMELVKKMFPKYAEKISWVTNGISLERWQRVRSSISPEGLERERESLRESLRSLIFALSGKRVGGRALLVWSRRITRYKRPHFLERLLEEGLNDRIFIAAAGKPHVRDGWGRSVAESLLRLSRERENLYFHPTYDPLIASHMIAGADLLLFTPFSGWEACGTSQMKAMVNGVPVISSRDGASLELIEDGRNGWLFGEDIREFINIDTDPRVKEIDEADYKDMVGKLVRALEAYESGEYREISFAAHMIRERASIERALTEYYPELMRSHVRFINLSARGSEELR